ncbi:MAG: short-chain dehydrogenase [Bacteroidota bacterium]|nr:short-chain dehydrogenase [Bacteroidota bacterium]
MEKEKDFNVWKKQQTLTFTLIMTVEQIETFLAKEIIPPGKVIRFELKKRNPIRGLIVQGRDYNDLKAKNFWRVVTLTNIAAWKKSGDINLAKIFAGSEFAKLSLVTNKVEEA